MNPDESPEALTPEVLIVGGGFAGLSAALMLGRARRRVVVVGEGPTRNAESEHAHNVPTREGADPQSLLQTAHDELAALTTVRLLPGTVHRLHTDAGGFVADLADGTRLATDRVILSTGARDALPRIRGLIDLWGRRAHSCPFCDAGNYPGGKLLVVAAEQAAAHLRPLLSLWTHDLTFVDPSAVGRLAEAEQGVIGTMADGSQERFDAVFVAATPKPRITAVAELGLEQRGPFVAVDGQQRTSLPGLWAVGDCAWMETEPFPGGQVLLAMAGGSRAGMSVIKDISGIESPPVPEITVPDVPAPTAHEDFHISVDTDAAQFWEDFYTASERWTGSPNTGLVQVLKGVSPGSVLDLGCGEGGDAVWLAESGWQVRAVDISATALGRVSKGAAAAGVGERVECIRADLAEGVPEGSFDLVIASYLLSPAGLPREEILLQARDRVAAGGRLVVLSHLAVPSQGPSHGGPGGSEVDLPDLPTQIQALDLNADWLVDEARVLERRGWTADGTITQVTDSVLVVSRR